jgi:CxxC motif-containing protein (DUF1111 family)
MSVPARRCSIGVLPFAAVLPVALSLAATTAAPFGASNAADTASTATPSPHAAPSPLATIARLGGPATVAVEGLHAFSLAAPGLPAKHRRAFSVGNAFFRDNWVIAPASAEGRDGLGPLFNANSCSACHMEDGRGTVPLEGEVGLGVVVFLSPREADGEPHPTYGAQLHDQAIPGVEPEARLRLDPVTTPGRYPDGTSYELTRWDLAFENPAYGPLDDVRHSMRVGQQLVGVGLLEAIDDATLLAMEDPDDRDGDGISGRAHRVVGADGTVGLGRFGWKASQPTLEAQVIAALHEDLGITSPTRPHEAATSVQSAALAAPSGGSPEIDDHKIGRLAHYCRVLAVPAQRRVGDLKVEQGRELFAATGCTACHVPELRTGASTPIEAFREVVIRPYTDLLLHDLGEGLADDRRDGEASGREWRTPPLWGLGLLKVVNPDARFLHDGRAATIEEAILWHGGEAEASRARFMQLDADERAALLAFLESL